ncbi:hypothetical protein M407DRAFT_26926 [Tulasnella calospora MUT 4182]|uniref:Uncharacterized protein n=1 Tax=Tulasnella calospora MUT 4182 TaxID=1051891 RepID=A0A0C3Q454_9AGAM|nr:hypothetical protein M407DRAFT_26926 [Tulasnella calospora MUT 4182]
MASCGYNPTFTNMTTRSSLIRTFPSGEESGLGYFIFSTLEQLNQQCKQQEALAYSTSRTRWIRSGERAGDINPWLRGDQYGESLELLAQGDPTLTRQKRIDQNTEDSEDHVLDEIELSPDDDDEHSEDQNPETTPPDVPGNTPVLAHFLLPAHFHAPPAYSVQTQHSDSDQQHTQVTITQNSANPTSTIQAPLPVQAPLLIQAPVLTPPTSQLIRTMYQGPNVFAGDSSAEIPAQWLRDFKCHGQRWKWHEGLNKQTPPVDPTVFTAVEAAFKACWPPDQTIKVTKTQLRDRVLARVITEEEVGQTVEEGAACIGRHVVFTKDIKRLAIAAGDATQMALWPAVRDCLPAVLQNITADRDYDTWQEFVEDMARISPESLQKRKRSLENEALVEQLHTQIEGIGTLLSPGLAQGHHSRHNHHQQPQSPPSGSTDHNVSSDHTGGAPEDTARGAGKGNIPFRAEATLAARAWSRREGIPMLVTIDGGAMANILDGRLYSMLRPAVGELRSSERTIVMANGTRMKSEGTWTGRVGIRGAVAEVDLEVFDSGGAFGVLLGKPFLAAIGALQDFRADVLHLGPNGEQVIQNLHGHIGSETSVEWVGTVGQDDRQDREVQKLEAIIHGTGSTESREETEEQVMEGRGEAEGIDVSEIGAEEPEVLDSIDVELEESEWDIQTDGTDSQEEMDDALAGEDDQDLEGMMEQSVRITSILPKVTSTLAPEQVQRQHPTPRYGVLPLDTVKSVLTPVNADIPG